MNFSQYRIPGRLFIGSLMFWLFAVTFPQTLHAAIYKWKDDKGKTHFTDDRSKIPAQFRQQKPHFTPSRSKPQTAPAQKKFGGTGSTKSQFSISGPVEKFYAMDRMGRQKAINIDSNTAVFAVATWCHYSKRFVNFLNDPNIAAKMRELKLVFVFEDEWPTIKKNLDKSVKKGEITQAQANEQLTRLKQKANWGMACDPSFMDDIPSEHYFASARSTKLKNIYPNSFPSAYSLSKNNFKNSISKWIRSQFKDQKDTQDFLVAEYKKYNKGQK